MSVPGPVSTTGAAQQQEQKQQQEQQRQQQRRQQVPQPAVRAAERADGGERPGGNPGGQKSSPQQQCARRVHPFWLAPALLIVQSSAWVRTLDAVSNALCDHAHVSLPAPAHV